MRKDCLLTNFKLTERGLLMSSQPRKVLGTRDDVPDIFNVPKYVAIHESFDINNNGTLAIAFADRNHNIIYQPAPLSRFDPKTRLLRRIPRA